MSLSSDQVAAVREGLRRRLVGQRTPALQPQPAIGVRPPVSAEPSGGVEPSTPVDPATVANKEASHDSNVDTSGIKHSMASGPNDPYSQSQAQPGSRPPKRAKTQPSTRTPRESALESFTIGVWEQLHSGTTFEPRRLVEQWRLVAGMTATPLDDSALPTPDNLGAVTALVHEFAQLQKSGTAAFDERTAFCRRITQAPHTPRPLELIVQARYADHFDDHVWLLGDTPYARRKAFKRACGIFGWTENMMRSKLECWRDYRSIRRAAGWVALVFAGMDVYQFRPRIGRIAGEIGGVGDGALWKSREGFEVAADTLHPNWRDILAIVGVEVTERRFEGHPHDMVLYRGGFKPMELYKMYFDKTVFFGFTHIDESVIDDKVWGAEDPRRGGGEFPADVCAACGMWQDDDSARNSCHCFPSLFPKRESRPPVQILDTDDGKTFGGTPGKRNGVIARVPFQRGDAVGEFVGVVTGGVEDADAMAVEAGGRVYQIWQGAPVDCRPRGNFTRFVNHSCRANAGFRTFVWRGTQRVVLVSKGVGAGCEVTVDYDEERWGVLDKKCLCGEECCRYK